MQRIREIVVLTSDELGAHTRLRICVTPAAVGPAGASGRDYLAGLDAAVPTVASS